MKRIYRAVLVAAAGFVGGLLLYALSASMTENWNEDVAAVWSWLLIFCAGFVAHKLIPRSNLSRLVRLSLAVLASVGTVIAVTWFLIFVLQVYLESGPPGTLLLFGAAEAVIAIAVFLPIYLMRETFGGIEDISYLVAGSVLPACAAFFFIVPPDDTTVPQMSYIVAAVFAAIGAAGALAFALVVHGIEVGPESGTRRSSPVQ